jgi:antitoxin ParD1/3/4
MYLEFGGLTMDLLHISMPENLKQFAVSQATAGGYGDVSEYVAALVRADQTKQAKALLEAELLKGIESGPSAPMTREDWDSIRNKVRERIEAHNS